MLDNWDILKSCFILTVVKDQSKSAEDILLNDNEVKAYILFLKYSLNYFTHNFNALFQSRKILIHKLFINSNH